MLTKILGSLWLALVLSAGAFAAEVPSPKPWHITGELTEACTCHVPCTCEFGQGPSPESRCHAVVSMAIDKGNQGAISLDGLKLGFAWAAKGVAIYIDASATAEQETALREVAEAIAAGSGMKPKSIERAAITQTTTATATSVRVGGAGGFDADMLIGLDGKTPIVVENNGDVNIPRAEKGKTKSVDYHDALGNVIKAAASNSSRGRFDWSDETKQYF
jgi:hypothetical protein